MMRTYLILTLSLVFTTGCADLLPDVDPSGDDDDSQGSDSNTDPAAVIELPTSGAEVIEGRDMVFSGRVSDLETSADELTLRWTSSIDGVLDSGPADIDGRTEFTWTALSAGDHTVTLEVTDPEGQSGAASVALVVGEDTSPEIVAQVPSPLGIYYSDHPLILETIVSDAEDPPADLRVSWEDATGEVLVSDEVPSSDGTTSNPLPFEMGEVSLTARVVDTFGNTNSASISVEVGPPNSAPQCALTAPAALSTHVTGQDVIFVGVVSDADIPAEALSVRFISDVDGEVGTTNATETGEVNLSVATLNPALHTVTMEVTDEMGASCSADVTFTVSTPPEVLITAPMDLDPFNEGDLINLIASVTDNEDPNETLSVVLECVSCGTILATPTPDATGAVTETLDLPAGEHLLNLTATDSSGLTGLDSVFLSINIPPTEPMISIVPALPTTANDLTVLIDDPSVDPDSGPSVVTYTYEWLQDGFPPLNAPFSPPSVAPSSQTARGQVWEVTVTASDGQATSAGVTASVTIINDVPSITSVAISPASGNEDTLFTCIPTGWTDADPDPEDYQWQWTVNGTPVSSISTIEGALFNSGDTLICTATPFDGLELGTPLSSQPVIIENAVPSVASVSIEPTEVYTDTELEAVPFGWADSDEDPESYMYEWFVDGVPTGGDTPTLLGTSYFSKHQSVTVTITPQDASSSGPPVSSSPVDVENSVPSQPVLAITPQNPSATSPTQLDDLLCSITQSSTDADGDPITYTYEWEENSAPTSYTDPLLPASATEVGDSWSCIVTPYDDEDDGTLATVDTPPLNEACLDDGLLSFSGSNCACGPCGSNSGNAYMLAPVDPTLSGSDEATIEFWLKLDDYSQFGTVAWSDGTGTPEFTMTVQGDCSFGTSQNHVGLTWGGATVETLIPIPIDSWLHYAAIFEFGTVSLYMDGQLQGTATSSAATLPALSQLYFGGYVDGGNGDNQHQVNGSYRGIRVSSVALYQGNFSPTPELPVEPFGLTTHAWMLDDLTGSVATDSVDPTYSAALINSPSWGYYNQCP